MESHVAEVWKQAPVVFEKLDSIAGRPKADLREEFLTLIGPGAAPASAGGTTVTIVDGAATVGVEEFEYALHVAVMRRLESDDDARIEEVAELLDAMSGVVAELFERAAAPQMPASETERCKSWWSMLMSVSEHVALLLPVKLLDRLVSDFERSLVQLRAAYLRLAHQRLNEFDAQREAEIKGPAEGEKAGADKEKDKDQKSGTDVKDVKALEAKRTEDRKRLIAHLGISPNGPLYLTMTSLLKQVSARLCSSLHAPLRARIVLLLEKLLAMDHKAIANNQKLRTTEYVQLDDLDGEAEAAGVFTADRPAPPAADAPVAEPAAEPAAEANASGDAAAVSPPAEDAAPEAAEASTPAPEGDSAKATDGDTGQAPAGEAAKVAEVSDAAKDVVMVVDKDAGQDAEKDATGEGAKAAEAAASDVTGDDKPTKGPDDAANGAESAAVVDMDVSDGASGGGEPPAAASLGADPMVDYNFYRSFWNLQEALHHPERIFERREEDNWITFRDSLSSVLKLLLKYPTADHTLQPWTQQEPAPLRHAPRARAFVTQLDDPDFRLQFLTQAMIAFQALEQDGSSKGYTGGLISRQPDRVRSDFAGLKRLCQSLLKQTHAGFVDLLGHVLEREAHWVTWKSGGCREFERNSLEMLNAKISPAETLSRDSELQATVKPRLQPNVNSLMKALRNPSWQVIPEVPKDDDEAAKATRSQGMKRMCDSYLDRLIEEDKPENGIEDEYKAKKNKVFMWQCRRLFSQQYLRVYAQKDVNAKTDFMDFVHTVKGTKPPPTAAPESVAVVPDEGDAPDVAAVPDDGAPAAADSSTAPATQAAGEAAPAAGGDAPAAADTAAAPAAPAAAAAAPDVAAAAAPADNAATPAAASAAAQAPEASPAPAKADQATEQPAKKASPAPAKADQAAEQPAKKASPAPAKADQAAQQPAKKAAAAPTKAEQAAEPPAKKAKTS